MSQIKSFNVEITSSGNNTLPASGLVKLRLLDVSLQDAPAISIAEMQLRCGGVMPINVQLSFDSRQVKQGHFYALAARIEDGDRLLYINTNQYLINLNELPGTERVTVEDVRTSTAGIHGGNRMV